MSSRRRPRAALVIVDMSVEQVADLSYRKKETIDVILRLANEADFQLVVDSHLWMGPDDKSSLAELYPDIGRKGSDGAMLIPELQGALYESRPEDRHPVVFVPKYNYSSFAGASGLDDLLRSHGIADVYLAGINTDYCIFATALDAFYARYSVHVVEEGVSSVCGSSGHRQGLQQIAKFGCARVVALKDVLLDYGR